MSRDHLTTALPIAGSAVSAFAQGQFIRVGAPNTFLTGLSADGSIAVGTRVTSARPGVGQPPAALLTSEAMDFRQRSLGMAKRSYRTLDKDSAGLSSAAIWQGGITWKTLGGVPGGQGSGTSLSTAYSVSADGSVIVGLAWITPAIAHGFRWDAQNGMIDLGSLQGRNSRASVVSEENVA